MAVNGVFGPRAMLLGHRGCGRGTVEGHRENTLDSFLTAVELGIDWVEVDVRRTRDDVLVVAHHPADDDGVFYADLSAGQAAARGVLRLDTLLDALPGQIGVDLDLKSSMEDAPRAAARTTMGLLAPVARREARRRPVLITSFDAGALMVAREQCPTVPLGLLTWVEFPVGQAVAAAAQLDVQVLALHGGSLKPNRFEPAGLQRPLSYVVETVHASGRELLAWCPGPAFTRKLIAAGADAICVNEVPAMLRKCMPVAASRAS